MSDYKNKSVEEVQQELDEAIAGRLPFEVEAIDNSNWVEKNPLTTKEKLMVGGFGFFMTVPFIAMILVVAL